MKTVLLFAFILLQFSCGNPQKKPTHNMESANSNGSLLENVRLAINPKYKDWVLFRNGTYIVFDNADTIADINNEAIRQMKKYGPVFAGGPAGDFDVVHLHKTEGWVVSGHGYGMYTYVSPSELENKNPPDIEIGLYGRSKRNKDGQNPEIIYANRAGK